LLINYTGLHGANRLASNSLIEALVYSHKAYLVSCKEIQKSSFQEGIPDWDDTGTSIPDETILVSQAKLELQTILSDYVGIVRSDQRLSRAINRLKMIYEESETLYNQSKISVDICELRNLRSIAYLVTKSAQAQKKNIGLHYNIDNT